MSWQGPAPWTKARLWTDFSKNNTAQQKTQLQLFCVMQKKNKFRIKNLKLRKLWGKVFTVVRWQDSCLQKLWVRSVCLVKELSTQSKALGCYKVPEEHNTSTTPSTPAQRQASQHNGGTFTNLASLGCVTPIYHITSLPLHKITPVTQKHRTTAQRTTESQNQRTICSVVCHNTSWGHNIGMFDSGVGIYNLARYTRVWYGVVQLGKGMVWQAETE